jgi:hypothetical protein
MDTPFFDKSVIEIVISYIDITEIDGNRNH